MVNRICMNFLRRSFVVASLLFATNYAHAQAMLDYVYDSSVKVYDGNGNLQTLAGCGGFNTPKFSMADLNHDGLEDLVVFENGLGVRTFINEGTAGNPKYKFSPRYALNFPAVFDYLIMADYNCDGVPDLFQQGSLGFEVFRGYYNWKNELCFAYYRDLWYTNDSYTNGPANAFNNPGDVPAIVDVDNDGDLDFISYDINGGNLNFYKNMRVEDGLPCDSIRIKLVDRCWGKVFQAYWRAHLLAYTCSENGLHRDANKKTHQGNTPCLFDYDGDGDYDYLDGSISFNEMTFLMNGKAQYGGVDSMISQDTTWQSNGHSIELPIWPTAFNVDVDQDGKKDLLIAPNTEGASENYKCVWFYKNNTTPGNPSWTFQSDTFLVDQSIDVGTTAYPIFYDYDKDGKPDLFIGSEGYYQTGGTLRSRLSYYKNTSTPGHPSFVLKSKDFLGLFAQNYQGIAPAIGDVDGDGKDDLVIGHTNGRLSYYKNMAASNNVQPVWQLSQQILVDATSTTIAATGGNATPFIYDIDNDGKPDLLMGDNYGYIEYFKNASVTPGVINLQLITDTLGGARVDSRQNFGNYSTVFIGRVDTSSQDQILMGSNSGNLYRFTGFQGGIVTGDYTMLDTQYCYIDSAHCLYNHPGTIFGAYTNFRSAPAVADIDSDGVLDMVVGDKMGGVIFYTRGIPPNAVPIVNNNSVANLNIYPNPAKDVVNLTWAGTLQGDVQIEVYNIEGQKVMQKTVSTGVNNTQLNTSGLAPGMYICTLRSAGKAAYGKFTVIK